jgi:hypothetical protein
VPTDLDPRFLQLAMFALATYPLAFSQITAMTTGMAASEKRFQRAWTGFLQQIGERLLCSPRQSRSAARSALTPNAARSRRALKGKE